MSDIDTHIYEFGDFRLDAAKRLLYGRGEDPVALTPRVFDTLLYLIENSGKILEKDDLMRQIWADTIVEENNLNKNISTLRRALGEKKDDHRFIVTIPGRGYKFVAPVRRVSAEPEAIDADSTGAASSQPESSAAPTVRSAERPPPSAGRRPRIDGVKLHHFLAFIVLLSIGAAGIYYFRAGEERPPARIRTIAVLPFKPILLKNRNESLEFGMADTLIGKLSTSEELIVRPLGSVRRYGDPEQDALRAGRELGVDAVLEGTLQTAGERIRVSARLFRTADGRQIWAERFDEKITDIFAVQDSISERVFAALTLQLSGRAQKHLARRETKNVEAYQLYMKGRFHQSKLILPEAKKAVEHFQQAIRLDPGYALAHVGIADAYRSFALSGDVPAEEAFPKAKEAARRAIELNPDLPESQVAVGLVNFWYEWNWKEAEKNFRRALELDPDNPAASFAYAHLNSNAGRHADATAMGGRARELDPLSLIINSAEGQFLFFAGKEDEAIARLRKTLELDPQFWHAHLVLAMIYSEKRLYSEALAAADRASRFSGGNSQALATKAYALARSGDLDRARILLGELQTLSNKRHVPAYNFAIIHNGLGETEKALELLERAAAEKNVLCVFLPVDPKWNNLRDEPRFIELIRRMDFN